MKILRRAALALGAAGLAAGISLTAGGGTAFAAGQVCAQSGTGYCLNDWNGGGSGNAVKMGQNGWPHQSFGNAQLTVMCGHGKVTNNCPFANLALDSALFNEPIETVQYNENPSLCVGLASSTSTGAVLTACPNTAGTGGGWGVIYVQDPGTCVTHLDNVRATEAGGNSNPWNLRSGGATGAQAIMSTARDGTSCWGTG
jgi:hypothetical protein